MLVPYNQCTFCNLKKLKKTKFKSSSNFYVDSIINDLKISKKKLNEIKIYKCSNCGLLQNNPWFREDIVNKIYSNIYGQHNLGWKNIIDFFVNDKKTIHDNLFNLINKNMKINSYAEFNSASTGLFFDLFSQQYKISNNFKKEIFKNTVQYLKSRQVAGKKLNQIKFFKKKSYENLKKIYQLKKKYLIKKPIEKFLFVDNAPNFWAINDNYMSVNSRSLTSEIFDLKILNIFNKNNKIKKLKKKLSLFGIFHTLDHTLQPKQIFDFAIKNSENVIIYCHIGNQVTKQHLFSFTKEFLDYLKNKNIYYLDLTEKIKYHKKNSILYFLCSKKKIAFNNF